MYRIRFHGRGGQGVKTAGQILGSAFFQAGFEVQDAPRYGAERRGAPVSAGVRAARETIDERGTIADPGLVAVADPSLFQVPSAGVLQGVGGACVLLILGEDAAATWTQRLGFKGVVLCLAADGEAAHPSVPLVGAVARLAGVITREQLAGAVRSELAALGAERAERELQRALGAYDHFAPQAGMLREAPPADARIYARPDWVEVPLEPARIAAPDIRSAANSVQTVTGFWRVQRPVIDYARCNRCSWVCSTLCPDNAITVDADRSPRIDYDHCKGCMVCVTVCPPHAIAAVAENDAQLHKGNAP